MKSIPYNKGYSLVDLLSYVFAEDFMPKVKFSKIAPSPLCAEIAHAIGKPIECLLRSFYALTSEELEELLSQYKHCELDKLVLLIFELEGGEFVGVFALRKSVLVVDSSREQPFVLDNFAAFFEQYGAVYSVHSPISERPNCSSSELRRFSHKELAHVFAGLNAPRSPEIV
jgi:hypothetical protein